MGLSQAISEPDTHATPIVSAPGAVMFGGLAGRCILVVEDHDDAREHVWERTLEPSKDG